eukprot:547125-Amphidinium_carterae.1
MDCQLWARIGALFLDELDAFCNGVAASEEKISDQLRECLGIVLVALGVPPRSLPSCSGFKEEIAYIFTDASAEPCVTAEHGIEIVLGGVLFLGGSGVPL